MVKHVFLGLTAAVMKLKHLPGFTRCSFAVALNLALLPSCVVSRMFACASHQEQKNIGSITAVATTGEFRHPSFAMAAQQRLLET